MGWAGLLPPPKIFSSKFFFFGGFESAASGICGFACETTAPVELGVPPAVRLCINTCAGAPMWLHVLFGTVPSRNAKE